MLANSGDPSYGGMTIVYRPLKPLKRKRSGKPAVKLGCPTVVKHSPYRHQPKPLPADPEADERVAEFFTRMGLRLPS